jgi:DUF4097 and DUF4098 domain-containing protein YvlB
MTAQTFDTPDRLSLEVSVGAGRVDVRAADSDVTTVEVRGARDPDEFEIGFTPGSPAHLTVEQRNKKVFGWGSGREVVIDVAAPTGADVQVDTGSADLRCFGDVGSVRFRSGSGDLEFERARGSVTANVASGDLRGSEIGGNLLFTSASGDGEVERVGGEVVAKTASGDLRLGSAGGTVQATGASGDVVVRSVGHDVTVRSVSGDVSIGVAEGTRVWLDLGATSGKAVSVLEPAEAPAEGEAVELHVTTVSGDIRVHPAA